MFSPLHCKHRGSREACALSSLLPQVASCPYSPLINRLGLNAWDDESGYRVTIRIRIDPSVLALECPFVAYRI